MKLIPVSRPIISGNELNYLKKTINSGWISADGNYTKIFEQKFSQFVNKRFSQTVSSGTAALDIAFQSIDLKKGDEVICPTFTIISCLNQIVRLGAKPILVDADENTFNVNPSEVIKKINRKTKAILIVHIYGLPVDVTPIIKAARKRKILVIEDAAEQIGQTYKNKPIGSFGDISTFSFFINKHITTGEGGMICTNSKKLKDRFEILRNISFQPKKQKFIHEELGWNYRMTNMQAAIGLAQLEKIKFFIKLKRKMGNFYNKRFYKLDALQLPISKDNFSENIYWVYPLIIKDKKISAKKIINELKIKGIEARPFFCPMHLQPIFKKMKIFNKKDRYPVSEKLFRQGFYIPSGIGNTFREFEKVSKVIIQMFSKK